MSNYHRNREIARTINKDPTLTDQAAAAGTDINVIVRQLQISGTMPGAPTPSLGGLDTTEIPDNLADALATIRNIKNLRRQLPPQLEGKSMNELLALTPDQLTTILTPPAKPQDDKPDDKPEGEIK